MAPKGRTGPKRSEARAEGPEGPVSGYNALNVSAAAIEAQNRLRRRRYEDRAVASRWLRDEARSAVPLGSAPGSKLVLRSDGSQKLYPARCGRCGWRLEPDVPVRHEIGGRAQYLGIEYCASMASCPVCSPIIRAARALEIQSVAYAYKMLDGPRSIFFVTLTMRHTINHPLEVTLEAAISGFRKLLQGRAWYALRDDLAVDGYVRAIEDPWSPDAGWHPHVHALFFCNRDFETPAKLEAAIGMWERHVYDRWADYVVSLGADRPTLRRGITVQLVKDDGKVLFDYMAKVQGTDSGLRETDVGVEVARADRKNGKRAGSIGPLDLLNAEARHGIVGRTTAKRLFLEYHEATRNRRLISWSRDIRKLVGVYEVDDDQILGDAVMRGDVVLTLPGERYDRLFEAGIAPYPLEHIERGDTESALDIIYWSNNRSAVPSNENWLGIPEILPF